MEEKKEEQTVEQKTSFIDLWQDVHSAGNIFNELSGELGELDFGLDDSEKKDKKKNWLLIAHAATGYLFIFSVVLWLIVMADLFLRTQDDNSLVGSLPICSYISWGVENYENEECKTLSMIFSSVTEKKEAMEKTVVSDLIILVPRKLQSIDILSSPKVRFIQEHTGNANISVIDAMNRFSEIKSRTTYQGEDIECKNITMNEQGEISISCEVYGGALIGPSRSSMTHTSREVALDFMNRLSDERGGFQIVYAPKTLNISTYSSNDGGIKSVFSTVTTLDMKLRYLPVNKM